MDRNTLKTLRNNHPTSSWALWSPTFPEDGCVEENPTELYEYIQQHRNQLRPSVVLLSLNPSTSMPSNFRNFHSTKPTHRNDQFRDLVEDGGLTGAYMTDLVEETVEGNSGQVEPTADDVDNLFKQLEILGREEYHIVCFLQSVFNTLRDAFDATVEQLPNNITAFTTEERGFRLHCYRVWFHANWGVNKDKIPELREQLSYIKSERVDGSTEQPKG